MRECQRFPRQSLKFEPLFFFVLKIVNNKHKPLQAYSCVELFCGSGNVARSMRYGLVCTAALDINHGAGSFKPYQRNAFDLSTPAGFAHLDYDLNCVD